jgi:Flp pilus assembly protein TadG
VEFALVVPIFLVVVFGCISFGVVFAQKLALSNAARQAARFGVVESRTCGQIKTAAQDSANTVAMSGSDVTVTVNRGSSEASAADACSGGVSVTPCTGSAAGDSIYVTLRFTSKLVIPLAVVKSSFPISGNGVFRCEYS